MLLQHQFACESGSTSLAADHALLNIRAAIAIRAPTCAFASPAFHGMTIVCDIAAAARPGCRAKRGLPILVRLQKRASEALRAAGKVVPPDPTEDDDLNHLSSTAKLRRISFGSPGKAGAHGRALVSPISAQTSPQSPRSVATSATLAEPMHYDAFGGHVPISTYGGAVQPPPPPVLAPITPGTSAYLNLSPLENNNEQSLPAFTFVWPPSSGYVLSSLSDSSPPSYSVPPSIPSMGYGTVYQIDANDGPYRQLMRGEYIDTGIDLSNMTGEDEPPFDFEMFVNQMGAGELGLGNAWA